MTAFLARLDLDQKSGSPGLTYCRIGRLDAGNADAAHKLGAFRRRSVMTWFHEGNRVKARRAKKDYSISRLWLMVRRNFGIEEETWPRTALRISTTSRVSRKCGSAPRNSCASELCPRSTIRIFSSTWAATMTRSAP